MINGTCADGLCAEWLGHLAGHLDGEVCSNNRESRPFRPWGRVLDCLGQFCCNTGFDLKMTGDLGLDFDC